MGRLNDFNVYAYLEAMRRLQFAPSGGGEPPAVAVVRRTIQATIEGLDWTSPMCTGPADLYEAI